MATGLPKTQWQNHQQLINDSITSDQEIYLTYQGKSQEQEILNTNPANCIKIKQIGADINSLYYGDNLPILAHLFLQNDLKNKIKLIYIDPPFATKSIFQSRDQNNAYSDLLTGSHYIEFLRKRLIFLREILADDGSIYIHLDENMAFHVKVLMDEIFGANNFRNWITRKKCNPKNYTKKTYGKITDYILFYTKTNDYIWNRPYENWTEEKIKNEYCYIEENTGRRYKKVPIHAPGIRQGETGKPWRGMNPPTGKHWQFTPQTLDEMDAKGEIYWSKNGNPRRKIYLDESRGIPVQDLWLAFKDAHNQNIKITGYPTEKNPDLLRRIIQTSSCEGDLILDCFAGSGTTLEVANSLKRQWLGIDNSIESMATILKRFAQGCEIMGSYVNAKVEQNFEQTVNQLMLFNPVLEQNLTTTQPIVKDFSLYAIDSVVSDLQAILAQF